MRLETRPPNIEGQGAIRQRQLLINCLRMRPDRIIMGEVRGEEAFDMLQAMNTGHEGSMTTIHANTPRDAISRLESMVAMGNMNLPEKSVRQQIASAITIVVQATRMSDGTRKVTSYRRDYRHGRERHQHAGDLHVLTRKGSVRTAKLLECSSRPASVHGSLNGFAFRVSSFCLVLFERETLGQLSRKGRCNELWD